MWANFSNSVMTPININKEQKMEEYEARQYLEKIFKESAENQSMGDISNYLKEITILINDNIDIIGYFQSQSIEYIEDFGELFDVEAILKEIKISLPINIPDFIKKIKIISKNSVDSDCLEKCCFICQICTFFIMKNIWNFILD